MTVAPPVEVGAVQETVALVELARAAPTIKGACGTPHLLARYASTDRRSAVLSTRLKVMTSPTCPMTPRLPNVLDTLALKDLIDEAWSTVMTWSGCGALAPCAPLAQFAGGLPVL